MTARERQRRSTKFCKKILTGICAVVIVGLLGVAGMSDTGGFSTVEVILIVILSAVVLGSAAKLYVDLEELDRERQKKSAQPVKAHALKFSRNTPPRKRDV